MNKEKQKQLIIDIMDEDAKDGLYKQQTAVEWLIEQIEKGKIEIVYSDKIHSIKCIPEIIQQAKEMDKQQKMDAYNQGYRDGEVDASNPTNISKDVSEFSNAENYIKETYGNNK
jgi:hypothetical protein